LQRIGGSHLRDIAPRCTASCVDVEAVANRLQRCVRLGRSRIWTSDLPHMRHAR